MAHIVLFGKPTIFKNNYNLEIIVPDTLVNLLSPTYSPQLPPRDIWSLMPSLSQLLNFRQSILRKFKLSNPVHCCAKGWGNQGS